MNSNGGQSPDPVGEGVPTWTWDVQINASPSQWVMAKTALSTFAMIGGGSAWAFSGVVAYRTRDANGTVTDHPQNGQDGVVDLVGDAGIIDVTFGYGIGSGSGNFNSTGRVVMEVWVA